MVATPILDVSPCLVTFADFRNSCMSLYANSLPNCMQQARFRLRPLCQAMALLVLATGAGHASAGVNLSHIGGTMGSGGGAGAGGGVANLGTGGTASQPQVSQQSVVNLGRVAAALSAQIAAQQAAAAAVTGTTSTVPNGLSAGGLQVLAGGTWSNALAPTQSTANGLTTVTVQQTAPQAVLDWNTFNIGRQTTLDFNQQGNTSWAVLNRIFDPTGVPSQILGAIKADGLVIVENRNGVIFAAGSQVNLGSLVATSAMIDPNQFLATGIYSAQSGSTYTPSFTNAGGAILVAPGAQISTNIPGSVTQGGGYVLLMGSSVQNQGSIATPDGQTTLAAGDNFLIRPGFSTTGNQTSTTIGNEVATQDNAGSASGTVSNTGLIQATTGDITLVGHNVTQGGVALSTTSVSTRGTIHLLNSASDTTGSITLTPDSVTSITDDPNSGTALDSQRAALLGDGPTGSETENAARLAHPIAAGSSFDDLSNLPDLEDESRVEIVTGGTVEFQGNSLTLATGGQIAVSAVQRVQVDTGATLDVSGSNITLPMAANDIAVNIQGSELADSPGNRDSDNLNNGNVFVDAQDLTVVPAGTGGDANVRDYTEGGLLEVSGELSDTNHTIGEWTASGGTITLSTGAAGSVVAQSGSSFNISGGSIQYQSGELQQSWVVGVDGRIYNVNTAPSAIQYVGLYDGFVESHPRWGVTIDWQNPLIAPSEILEAGYTVGRDAGSLILSTPTSIFEGNIDASVVVGQNQQTAQPLTVSDPYLLAQNTVPQTGTLLLGQYGAEGLQGTYVTDVQFDSAPAPLADSLSVTDAIPAGRTNTAWFNAGSLSSDGLGGLSIATDGDIAVNAPLTLASGAQLNLVGPTVDIAAPLTAHGGAVNVGNVLTTATQPVATALLGANGAAGVTLEGTGSIDTSGLFTNALLEPTDLTGEAFVNGGNVTVASSQGIDLASGSVIDTSSGGIALTTGKTVGGSGGSIALNANVVTGGSTIGGQPASNNTAVQAAPLVLDGVLHATGVLGGGTLSLDAPSVVIGDSISDAPAGALVLPTSFFTQGFSGYDITGDEGVTVEPGAQIVVTEPTYQFVPASFAAPTGSNPSAVLQTVLLPLYIANPVDDTVTQRRGASLTLNGVNAGNTENGGPVDIGAGALLAVDAGQSITLNADAQITVDGTLRAPGGIVSVVNNRPVGGIDSTTNDPNGLSIWLGSDATIDVAAQAFTATDVEGRLFGTVPDGGSIILGTAATGLDSLGALNSSDAFIVVRPGALLDASGTSAILDPTLGAGATANLAVAGGLSGNGAENGANNSAVDVASNGGSITLNSDLGIYLDGTFRALAGGAGAAGGTLTVTLAAPLYNKLSASGQPIATPASLIVPRVITIDQTAPISSLSATLQPGQADPGLAVGQAQFSANAISAGGFDNLSFTAVDAIVFNGNVNLKAGQSIAFNQGPLSDTSPSAQVTISAPSVTINGSTGLSAPNVNVINPSIVSQPEALGFPSQSSTGTLTVNADLIELSGLIGFGIAGEEASNGGSANASYNFDGFGDVDFVSQGDIRFTGATTLNNPQNLSFTAAQLFPVSGVSATVSAGLLRNGNIGPTGEIDVSRISDVDPAVPDSVFGFITLDAATVNQGGVVRAPLGAISLGNPVLNGTTSGDSVVNLLPGSITSVSANGLDIPYGGTADGTSYTQQGNPVQGFVEVGAFGTGSTITLSGSSLNVSPGATLDVSGGGTVAGAGFVAGSGGSVDVLTTPLVKANPANDAFSSASNQVYAVIPGFAGYAPVAPGEGSAPGIGQQITIAAGVPGLPAGTYTLLPADYALLPGGFRVELGKTGQNASAQTLALGNGSYEVSGHTGVANTGIVNALPTDIVVTPGTTVLTYSQYNQTDLSEFLSAQATTLGQLPPIVAADAGTLALVLTAPGVTSQQPSLSFQGTALFAPAAGGQPGTTTVTGNGDFEIYASAPTPGFDGVSLGVADLNAIAAPRLVIGGMKGNSGVPDEVFWQSVASNVTVDTGVVLATPEIFLVASGNITLAPGAELDTIGTGAAPDSSGLAYTAKSSTVLAASNANLNFLGTSTSSGTITIGANATILSQGTIAIATAGPVVIDSSAHFGTANLNLDVGTINRDKVKCGVWEVRSDQAASGC
jgi:filamentous hemagglutinin family protein